MTTYEKGPGTETTMAGTAAVTARVPEAIADRRTTRTRVRGGRATPQSRATAAAVTAPAFVTTRTRASTRPARNGPRTPAVRGIREMYATTRAAASAMPD